MMLSDLLNYLIVRNGQYIVGSGGISSFNLNMTQAWAALQPEIRNFEEYMPVTKNFNVNSNGQLTYDFTNDPNNVGFVSGSSPSNGKPPFFISSIAPVSTMTLISMLAYQMSPMIRDIWNPSRLIDPRTFIWEYRYPILYCSEMGIFDVVAHYSYQINEIMTESVLTDVEIVGIEYNKDFYVLQNILSARFLQLIGRSRRAFTYTDLPIQCDADQLVTEGINQYEEAMKLLRERGNWWLAVRP